jgi:hypothetical protein
MWRLAGLILLAVLGCSLNPQPEPPFSEGPGNGLGGPTSSVAGSSGMAGAPSDQAAGAGGDNLAGGAAGNTGVAAENTAGAGAGGLDNAGAMGGFPPDAGLYDAGGDAAVNEAQ